MLETIYDALEFSAFIVPIVIQVFLGMFTKLGWLSESFALTMYTAMSYACAGILIVAAGWRTGRCVSHESLVISARTGPFLLQSTLLLSFAVFSAMAPTTGISLKYCAKAAADFVSFQTPL